MPPHPRRQLQRRGKRIAQDDTEDLDAQMLVLRANDRPHWVVGGRQQGDIRHTALLEGI